MSGNIDYKYLEERIADGLLVAADAAIGMGYGNRRESDVELHARFIQGLRVAENSARTIGHARGQDAQGIGWVRLGTRLGRMLDASTKAVGQSVANTITRDQRVGRGPLWVKLGEMLKIMAKECSDAAQARSDKALVLLKQEYN